MSKEKKTSQTNDKEAVNRLVKRYPNGCPDHVIAKFLGISEKEVEAKYQSIIACLRAKMGV